jgi:hypothetical protein
MKRHLSQKFPLIIIWRGSRSLSVDGLPMTEISFRNILNIHFLPGTDFPQQSERVWPDLRGQSGLCFSALPCNGQTLSPFVSADSTNSYYSRLCIIAERFGKTHTRHLPIALGFAEVAFLPNDRLQSASTLAVLLNARVLVLV